MKKNYYKSNRESKNYCIYMNSLTYTTSSIHCYSHMNNDYAYSVYGVHNLNSNLEKNDQLLQQLKKVISADYHLFYDSLLFEAD